jgi:hypothetical protein
MTSKVRIWTVYIHLAARDVNNDLRLWLATWDHLQLLCTALFLFIEFGNLLLYQLVETNLQLWSVAQEK